jgi:hypothetical protein
MSLAQKQRELRVAVAGQATARPPVVPQPPACQREAREASDVNRAFLARLRGGRSGRTTFQPGACRSSARIALFAGTIGNFGPPHARRRLLLQASAAGVCQTCIKRCIAAALTFAVAEMQPAPPNRSASSK